MTSFLFFFLSEEFIERKVMWREEREREIQRGRGDKDQPAPSEEQQEETTLSFTLGSLVWTGKSQQGAH